MEALKGRLDGQQPVPAAFQQSILGRPVHSKKIAHVSACMCRSFHILDACHKLVMAIFSPQSKHRLHAD
jgi:hypothetical protein